MNIIKHIAHWIGFFIGISFIYLFWSELEFLLKAFEDEKISFIISSFIVHTFLMMLIVSYVLFIKQTTKQT